MKKYNIIFYDCVDSTNLEAKRNSQMEDRTVFTAVTQTGGRGRLGRKWFSDENGLWMSVLLKPDISPAQCSFVTLVAGLAVCGVIENSGIKWPNDIVLGSKKVCGILTEMSSSAEKLNYIVCGIGINLNNESFPDELSNIATSLYLETGGKTDREMFLNRFLSEFEFYYSRFVENGFSCLADEYRKKCITLGKDVTIIRGDNSYPAIAVDINENGELIVETENGTETVLSGEVSVRGIFGYV